MAFKIIAGFWQKNKPLRPKARSFRGFHPSPFSPLPQSGGGDTEGIGNYGLKAAVLTVNKKPLSSFKGVFNKRKLFLVFLILLFSISLLTFKTPTAFAGVWGLIVSPAQELLNTVASLLNLVFVLLAKIVALFAGLVDLVLQMDNFAEGESIQMGWRIVRDFANMSFVLILLFMAFATIFGFETYGMKRLLPYLVAAALLINFSLAIAGFLVDSSQYFSRFFLKAGVSGAGVSATLMRGLSLSRIFQASQDTEWALSLGTALPTLIEAFILNSAVLLIAAFVFAALSGMLFIRMILLSVLLVVSPIVWVFWILPATKKIWGKWWDLFLKWTFFAPIFCFFLYLALVIIQNDLIAKQFKAKTAELQATTSAIGFASRFFQPTHLLSYIMVIGFLIAGLLFAQKFGIYGAAGTVGLLKRGRTWATGKAKGIGRRTGRRVAERTMAGAAAATAGIPLVRRATQWGLAKTQEARAAEQRKPIEETKKNYSSWSDDNIVRAYNVAVSPRQRAALLELMAEKGIAQKADPGRVKQDVQRMQKYGAKKKDALKVYPHLADTPQEITQIIQKLKASELAKMSSESWKDSRVQAAVSTMLGKRGGFTAAHLKLLADHDDKSITEAVGKLLQRKSLQQRISLYRPDIKAYLNSPAGQGSFGVTIPEGPSQQPSPIIHPRTDQPITGQERPSPVRETIHYPSV